MKNILLLTFFLYAWAGVAQKKEIILNETNSKEEVQEEVELSEEKPEAVKLPFEFSKATSQKFNGGAPGSGATTMLTIFLKKLVDVDLTFNKIWLSNDKPYIDLKLKRKFQADSWQNYNADDELILFATSRSKKPISSEEKTAESNLPPNKFIGDALIEYSLNDKVMYYEIPALEKLEDINAQ